MNTLILLTFIGALLPYLSKIPVAIAMHKNGGYDNCHPRQQQAQLTGFGARALAAHQNAFEALIIFGIAMSTAMATNTASQEVVYLAIAHIVARIFYSAMYYLNINIVRSLLWAVATVSSFAIILLSMI
mgnify:CR=1 FL=1